MNGDQLNTADLHPVGLDCATESATQSLVDIDFAHAELVEAVEPRRHPDPLGKFALVAGLAVASGVTLPTTPIKRTYVGGTAEDYRRLAAADAKRERRQRRNLQRGL